ncbi:hypothetical protein BDQ17DRAFT_1353494 [Cyathus striatus]|nr:hypothetical protein BDQ17DRAFT_1353494 [Cyathus striatus]
MPAPYYKPSYKMYRCRYFDDRGRSLDPPCNQGHNCRFVHPEDPEWSTSNKTCAAAKKRDSDVRYKRPISSVTRTARAPPLPPQADVFRLQDTYKDEEDSYYASSPFADAYCHTRAKSEYRKPGEHTRSREASPFRITPRQKHWKYSTGSASLHLKSTNESSREHATDRAMASASSRNDQGNSTYSPLLASNGETQAVLPRAVKPGDWGFSKTSEFLNLFRELSELTNEATQLTDSQHKQAIKLNKFVEISTTLSGISKSAANTILPALDEIKSSHANTERRREKNLEEIGQIWDKIFAVISQKVQLIIEGKMQNTPDGAEKSTKLNQLLRYEGRTSTKRKEDREVVQAQGDRKEREQSQEDVGSGIHTYDTLRCKERCSGHHGSSKRRRLSTSTTREGSGSLRPSSRSFLMKQKPIDSDDCETQKLLVQMKEKIQDQARALETLKKENNELKNTLRNAQD